MLTTSNEWKPEQQEPCYPGCYYYSDSCFRKDCKGKNDAVDNRKLNHVDLPNVIRPAKTEE